MNVSHRVLGLDRLGGGIWLFSIKNRPLGSFIHFKLWHVGPACFVFLKISISDMFAAVGCFYSLEFKYLQFDLNESLNLRDVDVRNH